jgi:hypothetical protein
MTYLPDIAAILLDRNGETVLKAWEYKEPTVEKPYALKSYNNKIVVYAYFHGWKYRGESYGFGQVFKMQAMSGEDKAQYHGGSGRHNTARIRHRVQRGWR